jgi:hypothetical protein
LDVADFKDLSTQGNDCKVTVGEKGTVIACANGYVVIVKTADYVVPKKEVKPLISPLQFKEAPRDIVIGKNIVSLVNSNGKEVFFIHLNSKKTFPITMPPDDNSEVLGAFFGA